MVDFFCFSFVISGRGDFLIYAISCRLASNMNKIKKKKKKMLAVGPRIVNGSNLELLCLLVRGIRMQVRQGLVPLLRRRTLMHHVFLSPSVGARGVCAWGVDIHLVCQRSGEGGRARF